jgi:hypothetical protein
MTGNGSAEKSNSMIRMMDRMSRAPVFVLGFLTSASLMTTPALAESGGPFATRLESTTVTHNYPPRRWYGWQLLAVDAAGWAGAFAYQPATMTLLATGPLVHLLNGEDERAQASLAVRLAGAALGTAVSGVVKFNQKCPMDRTTCPAGASTILHGAAIGLAVADAIDVFAIAWTSTADGDDAIPPLMSAAPKTSGREVLPTLAIGAGGAMVSVGGTF